MPRFFSSRLDNDISSTLLLGVKLACETADDCKQIALTLGGIGSGPLYVIDGTVHG